MTYRLVALNLALIISLLSLVVNVFAQEELNQIDIATESNNSGLSNTGEVQVKVSQDMGPEVSVNKVVGGDGTSNMLAARESYDRGRKSLASALFPDAERALLDALKSVPNDTSLKESIESSLYIDLPLGAVNQLVASGRVEEAQVLVEKAILIAKSYPSYVEQLQAARNDLLATDIFNVRPTIVVDGAGVVDSVYQKMLEYRKIRGRFPPNRRVLDRWLPDGRSPLEHFRISSYRPVLGGYSLIIQNRTDPEQTLRIDATGVLQ